MSRDQLGVLGLKRGKGLTFKKGEGGESGGGREIRSRCGCNEAGAGAMGQVRVQWGSCECRGAGAEVRVRVQRCLCRCRGVSAGASMGAEVQVRV